jgi:rRNA processing protein Krr1/Pno1
MNDLLKDIETLTIVKNAVSKGVETEKVIELLDSVIKLKTIEITNFENEMEKEFARGIDRS